MTAAPPETPERAPPIQVWGIVNVTPDSFSDGGRFAGPEDAVRHALALRAEGADVLDVGGESTRPGADPVPAEAERARVVPVIRGLRAAGDRGPVSVDTRRAAVAAAALAAGADLVNDVTAGRDPAMFATAAEHGAGLVLMHMQGTPGTMQAAPRYEDVVAEVGTHLAARVEAARAAGIERVWCDPGIGFGKTLEHNLALLRDLATFRAIAPVLLGASRKSFLGRLTDEPRADRRGAASLACVARALEVGVEAVRVHDVRDTVAFARVWRALR